jgi:hypothetical protein
MDDSYLLIFKTKNIFASNITKILLFKNSTEAYEYAINIDPFMKRDKIYTLEEALNNKYIWQSNLGQFPNYNCKIFKVSSDVLWNIYQDIKQSDRNILQYFYKQLKLYNII